MRRRPFDTFLLFLMTVILIIQMVYQVVTIGRQTGYDAAYYDYNESGLLVSLSSALLFAVGALFTASRLMEIFKTKTKFVLLTFLYVAFVCFMSLLAYPYGPKIFAKAMINPSVGPLMLVVFYLLGRENPSDEKYIKFMYMLVPFVLIVPFSFLYSQYITYSVNMKFAYAYYAMYALPIILLIKHRTFRLLMVLFCITFLVFASKRTGIVAILFSAYLFFFVQNIFIEQRNKTIHMLFLPIFVAISVGIVVYINMRTEGFLSRLFDFNTISETNMNGRTDLWKAAVGAFAKASPLGKIFGQGAYVFSLGEMDMIGFAHNDFLSTLVYYGIIGFSLMLLSIAMLAKRCFQLIRSRSQYAAALAAGSSILFLCMNFSIVYYMPSVTMFVFGAIGYILGLAECEQQMPRLQPYPFNVR